MRVLVMMRAMEQDSGFRWIVAGYVRSFLEAAPDDEFILAYRTDRHLGTFKEYANAREVMLPARHKLLWDQVAIPRLAWQEGADLIFNPKFSVPLIAPCPVTMGLQEPAWWLYPDQYEAWDRWYIKLMLPVYLRRVAHLFPITRFVADATARFIRLPPEERITVLHAMPDARFRRVTDPQRLAAVRRKYGLPERFVLCVTRVEHTGVDGPRLWFPGKNPETAIRAFAALRDEVPHELVIAGNNVDRYLADRGVGGDELERVRCLGFVAPDDLPVLLTLCDLAVIPSLLEGFGMALVEAMACGAPVVASSTGACPEVGGDAPLYASPTDTDGFVA